MCQRNTNACDGQGTDHHCPEGIGKLFTQTAIVSHVLLMVHPVNDRASTEEEHRLKECVRQQVEHRDRVNANTSRNEHIAKLRTG